MVKVLTFLQMEISILVNTKTENQRGRDSTHGRMVLSILVNSEMA
jgi:hypothetical protein